MYGTNPIHCISTVQEYLKCNVKDEEWFNFDTGEVLFNCYYYA